MQPQPLIAVRDVEASSRWYQELLGCPSCHGESGHGDGASAATMGPDVWGNPQHPANFTRGVFKSGGSPEDIYRTFMTGIDGTAMPSYYDIFAEPDGESIKAGDAWNLVSYVLSFSRPVAPDGQGGAAQ